MKRDQGRSKGDLDSLQLIEESALRCKRIVESLLQFSRRSQEGDRRPFDLNRCVDDAAVPLPAQLKKSPRRRSRWTPRPMLPPVIGDTGQMGQVLLNLLQNGLYALEGKAGTLTVSTGRRDTHLFFSVHDTGSGIEPSGCRASSSRPSPPSRPGEGTGLGLAIAYRIVAGPRRPLRGAERSRRGLDLHRPTSYSPNAFPSARNS